MRSVFKNLEGTWSFVRTFPQGMAQGIAHFTANAPNEHHYKEEGTLVINGSEHKMYREYIYLLEGDTICTYFKETPPRLFQCLKREKDSKFASGEHACKQDKYVGEYEFKSKQEFIQKQIVRGPKKDYTITTHYKRVL